MKITLSTSPLNLNVVTVDWLDEQLAGITARRKIDEAVVRIVQQAEASPPWEVSIHLVTPGPDLSATTRGHTLAAAFTANLEELERILNARESKRASRARGKTKAKPPAAFFG